MSGVLGGGGGGGGGGGMLSLGDLPQIELPDVPSEEETPDPLFTPVPKKRAKDGWLDVDPMRGMAGTIATGGGGQLPGLIGPGTNRPKTLLGSG